MFVFSVTGGVQNLYDAKSIQSKYIILMFNGFFHYGFLCKNRRGRPYRQFGRSAEVDIRNLQSMWALVVSLT